jgi:opacity protein-like surface antigen
MEIRSGAGQFAMAAGLRHTKRRERMKRIIGLALLVFVLMPSTALAAGSGAPATGSGDQLGVYVGGHLGLGVGQMSDIRLHGDAGSNGSDSWSAINAKQRSENDSVFGGGVTVGYDFSPQFRFPVRVELDYTARARMKSSSSANFSGWEIDNGVQSTFDVRGTSTTKISLQTLLANAWLDVPTGTDFTPYFGGGLGVGFIRHKATYSGDVAGSNDTVAGSGRDHDASFAWSVGGGMAYDVTQNWTVDLGYRYTDAGKSDLRISENDGGVLWNSVKAETRVHDVMLGLRYTF